jgi:hypothetical protein
MEGEREISSSSWEWSLRMEIGPFWGLSKGKLRGFPIYTLKLSLPYN